MSSLINVVLLYGGKSGEHEISLISAASVLQHLNPAKYRIIPIGIDKEGRFFVNHYDELIAYKKALPVMTERSHPLPSLVANGHLAIDADVVFPVMHGPLYEDGTLQGLLNLAGVAYVGCDVLSSAIGMDKDMARRVACVDGVHAAKYRLFSWHAQSATLEQFCQKTAEALGWPLFVKPCSMGSSVGIHKVHTHHELMAAIDDARRYDDEVLVEECIVGREIEVAVLENVVANLPPKVTIAGEIQVKHPDGFYSYTAKYLESEQTDLVIPAAMNEALLHRLQQAAIDIFIRLKCKGLARVDFFVNEEDNAIYFSEINTLPGFTSISMYPKLWQASGIPYPELLEQLIQLALNRQHIRKQLVTHYQ